MNCLWCDKPLTKSQIYEFARGKSKGTSCSMKCSNMLIHYNSPDEAPKRDEKGRKLFNHVCETCLIEFYGPQKTRRFCSNKCSGTESSKRMIENNPMNNEETRKKAGESIRKTGKFNHLNGGNGKGYTVYQLSLFNAINEIDPSFELEAIENTGRLRDLFNSPNHYKIDIASRSKMIAIEVDGNSHKTEKIKLCDKKKEKLLSLKGWRVLRFSNEKVSSSLQECASEIMSMI